MVGDWVTAWLFFDVKSENEMSDLIEKRFEGEIALGTAKPWSRSLIYAPDRQAFGCRSIWQNHSLVDIISASMITYMRKELAYAVPYWWWLSENKWYVKAIKAWDKTGTLGNDPEIVELLRNRVGYFTEEPPPPMLRIV
jgi:hypothetical protein